MKLSPLGDAFTTPRRNLGFLRPLIRQEVIKIESSNFEHSSFTTVEIFSASGNLRHPVMLKQWEIEDSIVISR